MALPSSFSDHELVVEVWKADITASGSNVSYDPEGELVGHFTGKGEFNFVIAASGGYWSFSISFPDSQINVEEWVSLGLQYNVVVYSRGSRVWEGFVNQLSANISGLTIDRGPLLQIGNRVSATYARQAAVGNEIVTTGGLTTVIAPASPAVLTIDQKARNSQLAYGIFEKIVNAGTVWDNSVAEDIRDTWLNERSEPETSKGFALGGSQPPSVTINCLGWIHYLGNYIYNANDAAALATSTTISTKIGYVIDGDPGTAVPNSNRDPNNLFDASAGEIATNNMLVSRWEDQNTAAWAIIKDLVSAGDVSGNRYIFGLYQNRKIVYEQIPSDVEYEQKLADPAQRITTEGGETIFPWNVLPGKWMLFTDFLIGKTEPGDLRDDQRALFIERVAYSTPWGLQLDGEKVGTINQKLAQRGLGLATS